MHLNPADISDNLKHDSAEHADKESPGTMPDAEKELASEEKSEERDVQGIAREGGQIVRVSK